jgi:Flp pilus assembly protein TadG
MKPWRSRRLVRDERGQVSAFLVVLLPACLLCVGLVVEGGHGLAAKTRAIGQAQEAARAGAQELDLDTYRATGQVRLNPAHARTAAQTYLRAVGTTGTVTITATTVHVTVTSTVPTELLDLAGIDQLTVTGDGQAQPDLGFAPQRAP